MISALSTGEKFIPYRNNKLTQVIARGHVCACSGSTPLSSLPRVC